jgi:hypothetical protein
MPAAHAACSQAAALRLRSTSAPAVARRIRRCKAKRLSEGARATHWYTHQVCFGVGLAGWAASNRMRRTEPREANAFRQRWGSDTVRSVSCSTRSMRLVACYLSGLPRGRTKSLSLPLSQLHPDSSVPLSVCGKRTCGHLCAWMCACRRRKEGQRGKSGACKGASATRSSSSLPSLLSVYLTRVDERSRVRATHPRASPPLQRSHDTLPIQ